MDVTKFDATVYKVQTLSDGGLRVTLDLPESAIAQAAALMECKRNEIALKVSVEVSQSNTNGESKTNKRTARKPFGVAGG